MTGKQLLSAIGEIDDRFIEAAAPAKAPRRLWIHWCTAAACLLLIVTGITLWQSGIFKQKDPPMGGDDNHAYHYAYTPALYAIDRALSDREKGLEKWLEKETKNAVKSPYSVSDPAYLPPLLAVIDEFDIPREFIEKNTDYPFTPKELDALYSEDPATITRVFASPYAIVAKDRAFAPRFYLNATEKELKAYGIQEDAVSKKITLLRRERVIEDAPPICLSADIESGLPYLRKLYSLATVEELCSGDVYVWAEKKWNEIVAEKFPFFTSDARPLLLIAIEEFQISKEAFQKANSARIAYYEQRNESYFIANSCFTQEEIDILYSGDQDAILRAFTSPYALIIKNEACAPDFYLNATEAQRSARGITEEAVERKKALLRSHGII